MSFHVYHFLKFPKSTNHKNKNKHNYIKNKVIINQKQHK